MGVDPKRIYVDHGLTGTNRARPGLREALAACRDGDTFVVTEALLALPDAIAWCWAKGGDWRRRIGTVVTSVVEV